MIVLALLAILDVGGDQVEIGLSVAIFFGAYGGALVAAAVGLTRQQGWARGPVLITQLIQVGLAWNVRDVPLLAVPLAVMGVATIVLMVQPSSIAALERDGA
ncbi:hypothetical protein FE634_08060 [Nocardioides dongxiaopingii]|uniref:hypothetical protein n=1 Tax=Nocardioides TaxID=1839 RepID=UPI0010C76AD0|nr:MULTISPECIES: hypothetical protein [Nocardioides]QCW50373.1 hypothetical protein FE634_08060 [Nocardioides sp. S-1144]